VNSEYYAIIAILMAYTLCNLILLTNVFGADLQW